MEPCDHRWTRWWGLEWCGMCGITPYEVAMRLEQEFSMKPCKCGRRGACLECCCNWIDHHGEHKASCRLCGHRRGEESEVTEREQMHEVVAAILLNSCCGDGCGSNDTVRYIARDIVNALHELRAGASVKDAVLASFDLDERQVQRAFPAR